MLLNRRSFTALTAASVTVAVLSDQARAAARSSFKAIAFDGFPIIDSRPVFARVEEMFPGKGAELSASWRIRQFEYGWLRTLGGRYTDFWRVTEDALIFAARAMKMKIWGMRKRNSKAVARASWNVAVVYMPSGKTIPHSAGS